MTATTDFLLDTNMLGYLAEAKSGKTNAETANVKRRVDQIVGEGKRKLFINAITLGEAEYGLRAAPNVNHDLQKLAREVLGSFGVVLSVDATAARQYYAAIRAKLFQTCAPKTRRGTAKKTCVEHWIDPETGSKLGIDENDLWIVATAAAHNLTLVTNDRMKKIIEATDSSIRIENWTTT